MELLDQRELPERERWLLCGDAFEVARAIETLAVRGAPAIGCAAALGMAQAARSSGATTLPELRAALAAARKRLAAARPTGVNLFWALAQMDECAEAALAAAATPGEAALTAVPTEAAAATPGGVATPAASATSAGATLAAAPAGAAATSAEAAAVAGVVEALARRAQALLAEDARNCRALAQAGAALIADGARVLTHCNAGALATGGYGTALGVVRAAVAAGRRVSVWACETRPALQGARLTAWELQRDGIPVTVIADNMAAHLMRRGEVDVVLVGADRVAANGDVANKIGTYALAVLARAHGLPFFVAAPCSTLDAQTPCGDDIPIEERGRAELAQFGARRVIPDGVPVRHPAFDVTPAALVSALITERGVLHAGGRKR
ncbi:MAG: S-methyl-5-thioribose-1-phosphate isomerase [Deltaproteobacteria bacterium]|nr:S-methyl-5-thioribose-1-phosphate isomerase [Deltaproteobacteria bacterium]